MHDNLAPQILAQVLKYDASREEEEFAKQTLLVDIETSVDPLPPLAQSDDQFLRHRIKNRIVSELKAPSEIKNALKIEKCSSEFALFMGTDGFELHVMRCRVRACPTCAKIKSLKWYHRIENDVAKFACPKHITLTLRSQPVPLGDQIDHLIASFRRLRQQKIWKQTKCWGISTIEVTYNFETHLWHPHMHIIGNLPFIDVRALSNAWALANGGSPIIHIRAVTKNIAKHISCYVSKVQSVFDTNIPVVEVMGMIKGRRLVQKFGSWPFKTKLELSLLVYLGSLKSLIRRANDDSIEAQIICHWLCHNAKYAIKAAILAGSPSPPVQCWIG